VADLAGVLAPALAEAIGVQAFTAEQHVLRGGMMLVLAGAPDEARDGAARLERQGIRSVLVPEEEVRQASRPVVAYKGALEAARARLRGPEGTLEVGAADVLLVVRGPIARERQPGTEGIRKAEGSPLEGGLRIHLHRSSDIRPVEIDPFDLDLGRPPVSGSVLVDVNAWLSSLGAGIPTDTAFRFEGPALAPEGPAEGGFGSLTGALKGRGKKGPKDAVILDNTAQFRFYSAWRGIAERRRRAG
jgi:hypothetical protein